MSEVNYCKNLWTQFNKTDKSQKRCAELVELANREGNENFDQFKQEVATLDAEVRKMQEVWDSSFETLPDGTKIFGDEYNFLTSIGLDWKEAARKNQAENHIGADGRTFWLILDDRSGQITHLEGISCLTALRGLFVTRHAPNSVSCDAVTESKNLVALGVNINDMDHPEKLADLKSLQKLHLYNYENQDLGFLADLHKLKELTILGKDSPKIESLDFLNDCPNLETLTLQRVTFATDDFAPIANIRGLKGLKVEGCSNYFTNLGFLKDHPALEYLQMDDMNGLATHSMKVIDVSALLTMPNFDFLNTGGIPITPYSAVLEAKGIHVV